MKTQLLTHQLRVAIGGMLLFCAVALPAQATIYYVTPGGTAATGAASAQSWATACGDLQAVINISAANDTVFVAAGTYTGGFYMKEGVQVYGGFAGTETYTTQSKPAANPTILDGANTQRVLTQAQAFTTPTVWYGFTLQHGRAQAYVGAVVYNTAGTAPAGVLYRYDAATGGGYMVGLDRVNKQWSPTHTDITGLPNIGSSSEAKKDFSGAGNTAAITKQLGAGNYAAYWCDTLTSGGFDGWYLPACGELSSLYTQKAAVNTTLAKIGATQLSSDSYWSGSEYGALSAWGVGFDSGVVGDGSKVVLDGAVRAVLAFNSFSHLNNLIFAGGGALLFNNGVLRNCVVTNNAAVGMAGGVYAGAGAQVQGCLVNGNSAPNATGVYAATGSTVVNSTVVANSQTARPTPATQPAIGNYYYTDGSYSATLQATKELLGVVCAINSTNPYSGLVLNLANSGNNTWGNQVNWSTGLTTGGRSWRLPTIDELQTVYANRTVLNTAINAAFGTACTTERYWSGSELDAGNAWAVSFSDGGVYGVVKGSGLYSARAVFAF